ncbi:MAG: ABC-F family ATP-binding cassette domain-containing protein [Proteobacteria bacterium]|nr:ABC-F family ATP-binding cassette domain-containing protein [Pseudomonadota bacterium]
MIQVSGLTKYFGAQNLFDDLTWQIDRFQRTALVGHNGAGKSTLLRIIAGELDPDGGKVIIPKSMTIGYLPQEITSLETCPALDLVLSGKKAVLDLEAEIEALELKVQNNPSDENIEALGAAQHAFETAGGYSLRAEAQSIMASLGFRNEEFNKLTTEFSGGWQMRILLARLLLAKPDLLLLDEPTNHLDMESLAWLESFLAGYPGVLLIVSHDRAFLNHVIDGVAALDANGLLQFPGNYDHYLEMREALEAQLEKTAEMQRQAIAEKQAFIERFRYKATKAKQVQSRVKQIEKMESVQLLQNRRKIHFHFPQPERPPQILLELRNASKAYDDNVVYRNLDFRIYRGDKLALVAPNGAGKSTLIKMLANIIPFEGERLLADRVHLAHFAQHQIDALDFKRTLLEEAGADLPNTINMTMLRAALGAFLFTNEDVDKPVSILSGGEKNKLALAKILLRAPNLLLLDEPTNHLDLDSREALEQALRDYPGTIVVISHDRWFIDKVCNKIASIENGKIDIFEGTYSEHEAFMAARQAEMQAASPELESQNAKKKRRIESAQQREALKKATKHLSDRVKKLENRTTELETQIAEIDEALADPETYKNSARIKELTTTKAAAQTELDATLEDWMMAQAELDEALAAFEKNTF